MGFGVSPFDANRLVAAARILAGVMAGAVLLLEVLAADGGFHQALHSGGKAVPGGCVLCLLAAGQAEAPGFAPAVASPVWSSLAVCVRAPVVGVDVTYLASPSRAPPVFSLLPAVVA
jgi:hypothetical protein